MRMKRWLEGVVRGLLASAVWTLSLERLHDIQAKVVLLLLLFFPVYKLNLNPPQRITSAKPQ